MNSTSVGDFSARTSRGYQLRDLIGTGTFSAVYHAYQPILGRDMAVKVILSARADQPDFIRHFEAEAQLIARLDHPHIVSLYDYWREPGGAFLVNRWLAGGSLRGALQTGPWTAEATARLLEEITAALVVAHRRGLIHRHIKPENILLDEDRSAFLADFGIAPSPGNDSQAVVAGRVVGPSAYFSPEQACGEPLTPHSDQYSLGMVLYEMLTGEVPSVWPRVKQPDLPAGLEEVIQKATATDPAQRYPEVAGLAAAFRQALAVSRPRHSAAEAATLVDVALDAVENPYKGLRAFQEADAADFFGREALTEQLLQRMAEPERLLAVVGPSGSGKSSVVRAGLLPALRQGRLPGSDRWFYVEMLPGAHPLEALESALLRIAINPPDSLLGQLREDERGLLRVARQVLPDDQAQLVLVIDQFEEVFTLVEDEEARVHFLVSLVEAVIDPTSPLRVVLTLRADFYDRPLLYHEFGGLVRKRNETVLPLSADELRRAIVAPAERVGVSLEGSLVEAIVRDVCEQPGTLPLLQYALTELFERCAGRTLTKQAYGESGVLGALARRADEVYGDLDKPGQEAARQLFLRLLTPDEGSEATRRRVRLAELALGPDRSTDLDRVIDLYARYRLLTFDRDPLTRGPTVEVAHEALIRTWTRLRGWLDDSREEVRLHRRLTLDTAEWVTAGRDPGLLATSTRLDQFEGWARDTTLVLNQEERTYLQDSLAERERRQALDFERKAREAVTARRAQHFARAAAVLAIVGILAVIATLVAISQASSATRQVIEAAQTLTPIAQKIEVGGNQFESLRLAAAASGILQQPSGNSETAALLGIRALKITYTAQADSVLVQAMDHLYTRKSLDGHTDRVTSVTFSPDGMYALSGSLDHTARLWDLTSGQTLRILSGHTDGVESLAFSPDGKLALTGSWDHTARLWDLSSGQTIRTLSGHTDRVTSVAFSPDGRYALTGSLDFTARLWDLSSGQTIHILNGHTGYVYSVAFSPDGSQCLTGSADHTARLWDLGSGQTLRTLGGHLSAVYSIAFAPDGKQALTGSDDRTARLWDLGSGQTLRTLGGSLGYVYSVAFSPDGKLALIGDDDHTARLWDLGSGQTLRTLSGHASAVYSVAFSPNGKSALTGGDDHTLRLWDLTSGQALRTLSGHTDAAYSVAFSPDGKMALTGSLDHTARLWDLNSGQTLRILTGHGDLINSVAFSPDGKLALTGSNDHTARLWDLSSGQTLRVLSGHSDFINSVVFSPDGKLALTGSDDRTVRLWDLSSGQTIRILSGHTDGVESVAFSLDGKLALTGSADHTARLWDLGSGQTIRILSGHSGVVDGVAFSPDGKLALTGSVDRTARLWDLGSGQTLRILSGPLSEVFSVAISPDGRLGLTGQSDRTVRLWDLSSGQTIRILSGHTDSVDSVAFSPDGKYILTGSWDKTARLWDVNYRDFIDYACARVFHDFTDDERQRYGIMDRAPTCPQFAEAEMPVPTMPPTTTP